MKSFTILSAALLAGCVSVFDPVEHSHAVNLQFLADKSVCQDITDARQRARVIAAETEWMTIYTGSRAKNDDLHKATVELDQIADQMVAAYSNGTPSAAYCELKMGSLNYGARALVKMSGGKI